MILWSLPLLPALLGALLGPSGACIAEAHGTRRRVFLGAFAALGLTGLIVLAANAALASPATTLRWGPGLSLSLRMAPEVAVIGVLVPAIAMPVVVWAAAHEALRGLSRLIGLLVAFVGAMELLVLAADLLTLTIGWELVSGISWALIAHRWRDDDATAAASYAFDATRLGGLGLWVAAGVTFSVTGGFGFDGLIEVARGP